MFAADLMFACADINLLGMVLFECSFGVLVVDVVAVAAEVVVVVVAGVVVVVGVVVAVDVAIVDVVAVGVVGVAGCKYWVLWVRVEWVRNRMWDDRVLRTQRW